MQAPVTREPPDLAPTRGESDGRHVSIGTAEKSPPGRLRVWVQSSAVTRPETLIGCRATRRQIRSGERQKGHFGACTGWVGSPRTRTGAAEALVAAGRLAMPVPRLARGSGLSRTYRAVRGRPGPRTGRASRTDRPGPSTWTRVTVPSPISALSRATSCGARVRSEVAQTVDSARTTSTPSAKDSGQACSALTGPTRRGPAGQHGVDVELGRPALGCRPDARRPRPAASGRGRRAGPRTPADRAGAAGRGRRLRRAPTALTIDWARSRPAGSWRRPGGTGRASAGSTGVEPVEGPAASVIGVTVPPATRNRRPLQLRRARRRRRRR